MDSSQVVAEQSYLIYPSRVSSEQSARIYYIGTQVIISIIEFCYRSLLQVDRDRITKSTFVVLCNLSRHLAPTVAAFGHAVRAGTGNNHK